MSDRTRPTIYDVASQAGVAISTVSRVINGSPDVSEGTRSRVQAAIDALAFRPQRTAKSLAQQQTHALAVAMPSATSLFYVEILKGVKDVLRDRDIDLLLCNLGSVDPEETLLRFLQRGAVDALLLTSLPVDEALARELHRIQAPVVLAATKHPDFDTIACDSAQGARDATDHLIQNGHQRIGLITPHPWSYNYADRLSGYQAALKAGSIPFDPELVQAGETTKHAGFSEEAGREAMERLLDLPSPPTAVFAASDVQAFGAWAAARDRGILIPRDLALVGYDDLKLSRFLDLTTVDQHMYSVGRRATERLLQRIEHPGTEREHVVIEPELVVRGSSSA